MEGQGKVPMYNDLLNKLQRVTDSWVSLLQFSGGDIEVNKSFFIIADWKEHKGRLVCRSNEDIVAEGLEVEIPVQNNQLLPWKDANKAERYLGVRLSPSGETITEREYLRQESKLFGHKLHQFKLRPHECWIAYMMMWKPKVGYPLPATSFTRSECITRINGPCEANFMARIGINRHFPKVVAHAPCSMGGLGLFNTYVEQGLAHVKWFVGIMKSSTCQIRPLLLTNLALTQIEAGVSTPILKQSQQRKKHICRYLTPTWITYLLGFLAEYGIDINVEGVHPISGSKDWTGDSFIMERTTHRSQRIYSPTSSATIRFTTILSTQDPFPKHSLSLERNGQ
jgi:hypothetical protein